MNRRSSFEPEERKPLLFSAETSDKEIPMLKNSYVPSMLPEWENWCSQNAKTDRQPKSLDLQNPTACTSRVGWKGRVEYALEHIEKSGELDENLLACLLECVVTTVIGLAADQVLPEEYLHCCLLYLQNIKDEFGENPPNIAAFIEYITSKLSKGDQEVFEKLCEEDLESVPLMTVNTRLPKSLQKKLPLKFLLLNKS